MAETVDRLLAELEAEWPPTPDLAPEVRRRLSGSGRAWPTALLLAAAVAAALASSAAVSGYLGLRGATLERSPRAPVPSASSSAPAGTPLDLAEIERQAGFRPLVPAALGPPDSARLLTPPGAAVLLYQPRPGLPPTEEPQVGALVIEARGEVGQPSFGKIGGPGTRIEPVPVNGGSGFWITGAPHAFFFYGSTADSFRLAGDVLIWNQGGLVVRIESRLARAEALRIAATMR